MPFWLVYMEIYSADFLTPSFVICIIKHHHHQKVKKNAEEISEPKKNVHKERAEGKEYESVSSDHSSNKDHSIKHLSSKKSSSKKILDEIIPIVEEVIPPLSIPSSPAMSRLSNDKSETNYRNNDKYDQKYSDPNSPRSSENDRNSKNEYPSPTSQVGYSNKCIRIISKRDIYDSIR
jgi:hypothetical protein